MKFKVEHLESMSGNFEIRVSLLEETPQGALLIRRMSHSSRTASADTEGQVLAKVEPMKEQILRDLKSTIRNKRDKDLFNWVAQPIEEEQIDLDQLLAPS